LLLSSRKRTRKKDEAVIQIKPKTLFASAVAICGGKTYRAATSSPNNTASDKREKNADISTPIRHSRRKGDIDLGARIRREINKDHALSMTAKNIKIVAIGGHVTLRGPVKTEQAKSEIEARAAAIAGSANIDDQLKVATQ
jgi:hyperosmotically inducible protein